jgi:hypothetical protein
MSTTRAVASALLCLLLIASSNHHGCCANKHSKSHKKAHASPPIPTPTKPGGGYGGGGGGDTSNPSPVAGGGYYGGGGNTNNNGSIVDSGSWLNARATWYGAPNGAGPEDNGGACGFKNVHMPPFSAMTSCGNEPIFKDGLGCGSCYQVHSFISSLSLSLSAQLHIDDDGYGPRTIRL